MSFNVLVIYIVNLKKNKNYGYQSVNLFSLLFMFSLAVVCDIKAT